MSGESAESGSEMIFVSASPPHPLSLQTELDLRWRK